MMVVECGTPEQCISYKVLLLLLGNCRRLLCRPPSDPSQRPPQHITYLINTKQPIHQACMCTSHLPMLSLVDVLGKWSSRWLLKGSESVAEYDGSRHVVKRREQGGDERKCGFADILLNHKEPKQ